MKRKIHFAGLLLILTLFFYFSTHAQQTYVLIKNRTPQLHVTEYKQVAIGDIVGPVGIETERSLDFRDDLTSRLFNSNPYEVLDRNALAKILSTQKNSNIKVIDEKTISSLGKQLSNAFLITSRMQTEKLGQKLASNRNGTCPANTGYYWQVTGEVSVQLKILDVKTGKMFFSGPVTKPVHVRSKETCEETKRFDMTSIANEAFKELVDEAVKLVIPYTEQININFQEPSITVFKNPFAFSKEAKQKVQQYTTRIIITVSALKNENFLNNWDKFELMETKLKKEKQK